MGNPTAANIIKSGAIVYKAPVGETIPDETTVGAGVAWGGDWERIGYTGAPLKLVIEDERMVFEVEEELMEVDERRIMFTAAAETELAELTAAYLSMIFGGTVSNTAAGVGQVGYEELDIDPDVLTNKWAFGFEGTRFDANENELAFRIFFYKCGVNLNGEMEFSKKTDTYTKVPIRIKILKPDSGTPIKWQRITAPATA
jgi:hypothetical protein